MADLYTNENFPFAAVEELRRLGHDVKTTRDQGKAGKAIPDPEVLCYSNKLKRALVTLNRKDFIKLHRQGDDHCGVICCHVDTDTTALASRIHDALSSFNGSRTLIRVNKAGTTYDP